MKVNHQCLGVISHGMTLVELLVVMTISAVLLAAAIPSFISLVNAGRLRGVADNLSADLRVIMSEATKRGEDALISFQHDADGSNWCYGLSVSIACNCREANSCLISGVERITRGTDYSGVQVTPTHSSYRFKTKRATVTAGNVLFTAQTGSQLKVIISGYGRIKPCSPAGSNLSGYPVCP